MWTCVTGIESRSFFITVLMVFPVVFALTPACERELFYRCKSQLQAREKKPRANYLGTVPAELCFVMYVRVFIYAIEAELHDISQFHSPARMSKESSFGNAERPPLCQAFLFCSSLDFNGDFPNFDGGRPTRCLLALWQPCARHRNGKCSFSLSPSCICRYSSQRQDYFLFLGSYIASIYMMISKGLWAFGKPR